MTRNIFIFYLFFAPLRLFAQDPDIAERERAVMEEIFRTSDQPGEIPVARGAREKRKKRVSVPEGAFRVGCVCMDDTQSGTRSTGACSGHGGVRFWVYQTKSGDTVHVLTARHERHPHALTAVEMSEINQKMIQKTDRLKAAAALPVSAFSPAPVVMLPPSPTAPAESFSINDAVFWAIAAVAVYFLARLVLGWAGNHQTLVRYALRNLLRSGKRPPPRQSRKNPRKKRVP